MPLVKFIPRRPNFATTQTIRSTNVQPSQGPILVPTPPVNVPNFGPFSNAFSNAFDN